MSKRDKSIILTDKQDKLVDGMMKGKSATKAAIDAGYSTTNGQISSSVTSSKKVKAALAVAREELADLTTLTRGDVLEGMLEAINLARTAAEPATMIAGWREIAKILGHYEPETKKIELTVNQQQMRSKLEVMSDEDLLQLIDGSSNLIEGTSTRVQ